MFTALFWLREGGMRLHDIALCYAPRIGISISATFLVNSLQPLAPALGRLAPHEVRL